MTPDAEKSGIDAALFEPLPAFPGCAARWPEGGWQQRQYQQQQQFR